MTTTVPPQPGPAELDTQTELDRLRGSGVKVLGYYEGDIGLQRARELGVSSPIPLAKASPGFSAKTRKHLGRRVANVLKQQEKLGEREAFPPERVRRISAIPLGEVKRLFVGGSGACAGVE